MSSEETRAEPVSRRRRRILGSLTAILVLIAAAGGWVLYQNSYDLREQRVTIPGDAQPLHGVLALPKQGAAPFGLVVFVHGDGPIDATHDTFYRPIWESLARAGYASLSWDKPGIAGAPGDWLNQTMADRTTETLDAIAWARTRPEIDPARIGLWGASQAGWVLPAVAARDPLLQFMIAVSPAVNWLQQGRYNMVAELTADGATSAQIETAIARSDRTRQLLRDGATFEQASAAGALTPDMTAQRWRFIQQNYTADASADLAAVRIPVLLILADHDRNVDVVDTETRYRQLIPADLLRVEHYPDATHALLRKDIEDSTVKTAVVAIAAPRSLFAEGFLRDQCHYVRDVDR
ncbi:CocE/NonD family hydrolase [Nocardia iowensis]|uniref:Alpha/beta hydrolase n=1 Tax=Nocardia iowensis TaxID=204891 RepID=A0ABX8RKP1_NOCIO|nr:alpha/beta fold hydrolase [Nocardia iowensis]QXN89577.1 alpha/beta hydrolase [Nocardia iowensis]